MGSSLEGQVRMVRNEYQQDGKFYINGKGQKHNEPQLREAMEQEINRQLEMGRQVLDHGCGEHSPGYVEWHVVAAGKKVVEKPKKEEGIKPILGKAGADNNGLR